MFQCATTWSECPWLTAVWALLSAGTSIVCSPACGPYHGSNLNPDPPNRTHPMVKPWRGNEQRIMLACLPVIRLRWMKTKTCKYFHPLNHNKISRVWMFFQFCNGVGATFWTQGTNPFKLDTLSTLIFLPFVAIPLWIFPFLYNTFWMSIGSRFEICSVFQTINNFCYRWTLECK